ncbi:hypothetical protein B7463_g10229, partial [Scytalidium lignicola]
MAGRQCRNAAMPECCNIATNDISLEQNWIRQPYDAFAAASSYTLGDCGTRMQISSGWLAPQGSKYTVSEEAMFCGTVC